LRKKLARSLAPFIPRRRIAVELPLVSIPALTAAWIRNYDMPAISKPARETLVPVTPGLPISL
jgi:hypothetical protein